MEIQNSVVTINETKIQLAEMHEMGSTLEFNSHTVQGIQLL